ncbi:hypothetical protein HanXRQr2_Chr12g0564041 [Helianthus annuus]|uniref:Uncharacterized protein n=1 Tax=Helianthus annuus TaxID=4232 RepID=A0A9K3MY09_HELAN|nr:hypothetical protein HanXRQr2_Chr12g0564041 [Helianthus annuus]
MVRLHESEKDVIYLQLSSVAICTLNKWGLSWQTFHSNKQMGQHKIFQPHWEKS